MSGYRCKYFRLEELVYPDLFHERGERCWEMFNCKALVMLDTCRGRYGAITVNNWMDGGQFHESGARRWDTTTGAKYSMHKLLSAFDMKPKTITPIEMQQDIMRNQPLFAPMTCMEDATKTVTWLHADVRNHNAEQQIIIVQP